MRNLSEAVLYEGLAEEAAELAAISSKMARILRNENPAGITMEECYNKVIEELSDVTLYLNELNICPSNDTIATKYNRWNERLDIMGQSGTKQCGNHSTKNLKKPNWEDLVHLQEKGPIY